MNLLLVFSTLTRLGGMETLIVRMAQELTRQGHRVSLLISDRPEQRNAPNDSLIGQVRKHATVLYADTRLYAALPTLKKLDWRVPDTDGETYDVIFAFESASLVLAFLIQQEFFPKARVATGVYSPWEYCSCKKRKRVLHGYSEAAMRVMPLANVFGINSNFLEEQGKCLERDFSHAPIVPIGVDTERFAGVIRRADRKKIVSIGRITVFKTYNFTMLDTLQTLSAENLDFEYHIYGDGDQFSLLQSEIERRNLGERVFLHGALPYSDFATVLEDAFLFVGMGTAAVEAAACGVPVLSAIESMPEPLTYGFLHETTGQNIGEINEGEPTFTFAEKISAFTRLSESEYHACEARSRERAAEFGLTSAMTLFAQGLANTEPFMFPVTPAMRLRHLVDSVGWKILPRLGIPDPAKDRFNRNLQKTNS